MARLHQFCNLGSVKIQVTIQFACFLKGCVSNDDLLWDERVGSEGSALDTHNLGEVDLESGSRGGLCERKEIPSSEYNILIRQGSMS